MVFSGLTLRLDGGCVCVLTGDNGAGKTSLLRILAGLLPAHDGQVAWKDGFEARHWIGQRDGFKDELTLAENLAFYHPDLDTPNDPFAISVLMHKEMRILSHGQRRRAHLHRLFLAPRPVWLLDEPETGLDSAMCEKLRACMRDHAQAGGLVLAASHHPSLWAPDHIIRVEARI